MKTAADMRNGGRTLLFLTLFCLSGSAFAAAAGRVVFSTGAPQAIDSAGATRTLSRGADVFAGDRLVTDARSRLQVGFVDGAYISLQPGSEYVIEVYNYSGKPDGTEQAAYRLVKGGVRAVTGAIGKRDPETYKVHTAVATIGIRGTGHNSRICQGDCVGRKDGLYHNTWEGKTYLVNDVSSMDIPTGMGAYVEAIDKPIVRLDQASAATAVDTGSEQQDEQESEEERVTSFAAGDQRNEEGIQSIIEPDDHEVPELPILVNQSLQVVNHEPDPDPGDLVGSSGTEGALLFLNDEGKLIGALGVFEETVDGDEILTTTLGTIDLDGIFGFADPELVAEVNALIDEAAPGLLDNFNANRAQIAEFGTAGNLSFGRWADGNVLIISDILGAYLLELDGYQSMHFIYGPDVTSMPTAGVASYAFSGGTQSTSVSGATIGQGVTNGMIEVDFGSSQAFLEMDVNHNSVDYFVHGELAIESGNGLFGDSGSVLATTTASGSACNPSCNALIDGGFAGPDSGGIPKHIGLGYHFLETDPILGVAGFTLE